MSATALCAGWAGVAKPVIGMLHLPPLPGSPRFGGDLNAIRDRARADAQTLAGGGVHGLMIENFGDVPFHKDQVGPETVAVMTAIACAVRGVTDLPLGINVLRNDAVSALAVASACGAAWVRVNVLTAAVLADQGVIEGRAAEVMRYRRTIGAQGVKVLADVQVKHAASLVARPIEQEVDELIGRGLADGIIVSGWGTGAPTDPAQVQRVKDAAQGVPVLVGSGVTPQTIGALAEVADGFIVGTGFKAGGCVDNPVDQAQVAALLAGLG